MKYIRLIPAVLLIVSAALAYSRDKVATPKLSAPQGALSPGAATIPGDATPGATIYYTVDGATPSYETNSRNGLKYPTGTTMEYRPADYPHGFLIYGPKTIKLLATKFGMADSAVASYSYTLAPPTGMALSACGRLASGTRYYLINNVSSPGTCMRSGGDGWILNLNGRTITYGTARKPRVSSTAAVTNGTTTVACSSCSFTPALVGDQVSIDDASENYEQTTVASYVNVNAIRLSQAPNWSGLHNRLHIWSGNAVHGIDCDASTVKGCKNASLYNGTITQASTINPRSSAVHIGAPSNWNDNGHNIISDLKININSQDVIGIEVSYGTYGDRIQFNSITDTSTVVYNRDHLVGYPIKLSGFYNSNTRTKPLQYVNDNVCNGSPQGCVEMDDSGEIVNNRSMLGPVQYVGGYCVFAASAGIVVRGNFCSGETRGLEFEASYFVADSNIIDTQDSSLVHDPGHNSVGCEIGGNYGIRVKDYVGTGTQIVGSLVKNNQIAVTEAECPAQGIRFTQVTPTDTIHVEKNDFQLVMTTPSANWSSIYSVASTNGRGILYRDNTYAITGTYAPQGYAAFIAYDGAQNWTLPSLVSPAIFFDTGTTNSSAAFAGKGTPRLKCSPGGTAFLTATWNGAPLPCP